MGPHDRRSRCRRQTATGRQRAVAAARTLHAFGGQLPFWSISRILFTGDLGVSLMSDQQATKFVTDLAPHIPLMEGSPPLHGVQQDPAPVGPDGAATGHLDAGANTAPIKGQRPSTTFDWIETLMCGVDLFDDHATSCPRRNRPAIAPHRTAVARGRRLKPPAAQHADRSFHLFLRQRTGSRRKVNMGNFDYDLFVISGGSGGVRSAHGSQMRRPRGALERKRVPWVAPA